MRIDEDLMEQLVRTLLEAKVRADRLAMPAANDSSSVLDLEELRSLVPWWWLPKCPSPTTLAQWRAFAHRRCRFAAGLSVVAVLPLLLAALLPDPSSRWMFFGFSCVTALVAAWQWDVGNRELQVVDVLAERMSKVGREAIARTSLPD